MPGPDTVVIKMKSLLWLTFYLEKEKAEMKMEKAGGVVEMG